MPSISMSDMLTVMYVLVDDWWRGQPARPAKRGPQAVCSDSEVLTLMLAQDLVPFPGEAQFLGYVRANHRDLFPRLLTQSQFNRRSRGLRLELECFRREVLARLGVLREVDFLLDTKPVPVLGYKRSKARTDFAGSAAYGVCPGRGLKYYGYKLVALVTPQGIPAVYDLVPADLHDRPAAEAVVVHVRGCDLLGDKAFLSADGQAWLAARTGNRLYTPKKANQLQRQAPAFERWLHSTRQRIEGAFHELQNTGRNLERLRAKTLVGLCTRVCAKLASHALRLLLRQTMHIDIQTFTFQVRPA